MRHFTPKQLHDYLQQAAQAPLLLDVRESWEFDICRITGSELIPMGQIASRLIELEPSQETVLICHHGVRSRQVAQYLETQGFENLINLSGGVDAWAHDIDVNMSTY